MPRYIIILLPRADVKPGGIGITNSEERQFANLGEALQRAREMYNFHKDSAGGFQIRDAANIPIHEWKS
ncbi:MAG: hypothetical protein ACREE4_03195 [Stellaceae bacterium]